MSKKITYEEKITDWVLQFGHMDSPTDCQFSAYEVANLIIEYNRQKRSGLIK